MSLSQHLRSVVRAPGTAASIVLTIALGVAALTMAFGIADAAIWRQPPLVDASRLVVINSTHDVPHQTLRSARWSYARIQLLRREARSFAQVANFTPTALTLTGRDEAERVDGEIVSPEYFSMLAVRAARGRAFTAGDDAQSNPQLVAVISHTLWQRQFAADSSVVGKSVNVNGRPLTIVGVMPPGFAGLTNKAQLWIPTVVAPLLTYPEYLTTDQNFINVTARLKNGVPLEAAQTEMKQIATRVFSAIPIADPDSGLKTSATVRTVNEVRTDSRIRRSVLMLLAAVTLLHILACTNVASLLLGRAAARQREIAVRTALGATVSRLLPVLLFDGTALIVTGGLLGVMIAYWTSMFLQVPPELFASRFSANSIASFSETVFGIRNLGFALALVAVTVLLVIWVPATALLGIDVSGGLRDGARGFTSGAPTLRRPNLRGVIVSIEAALAMLLLVTGSLMIDSFARMQRTDLGIDANHLLTFDLRVPDAKVPAPAAPAYITRILAAISSVPGVVAASVDGGAPVSGSASSTLYIMSKPMPGANEAPPVLRHYVGPDHFRTMGIPVISGRIFTAEDVGGRPHVVIISQSAARRFWGNENPIGQRVWFGGGSTFDRPDSSAEIVGIVGDVAYQPLDRTPFQTDFYTPYMQFTYASRTVFVRTTGDPLAATPAIRRAIRTVDADVPLVDVQTMPQMIGRSWVRQRFDALLFGGFAVLALLLSATGIYAVVSYTINQRTREMGIRLALGATGGTVIRLVIREGMAFPIAGLAIGLLVSIALSRVIGSALYEVSPTDVWVLLRTAVLLGVVSALACLGPALRATRVDPLVAMRDS